MTAAAAAEAQQRAEEKAREVEVAMAIELRKQREEVRAPPATCINCAERAMGG